MNAVITFDLENASTDDYRTAYDILERFGLASETSKGTELPTTTVIGPLPSHTNIADFVDDIREAFIASGLSGLLFGIKAAGGALRSC